MKIAAVSPRRSGTLLTLSMLVVLIGTLRPFPAAAAGKPRPVRVETRNLYLGADLTPAITAPNLSVLAVAASTIWQQVLATNFPARAQALAAEIDDASPLLVGLQEVALWRTGRLDGPPALGGTPATDVAFDFLALLLDALAERGLTYDAVVVQQEADLEAPATLGFDIRLTMRDVILAKAVGSGELTLTNPQSANYTTNLTLPIAGVTSVTSTRGWTSIDVTAKHRQFRFVNTHLEAFSNFYRSAQALELLTGPLADHELPVVLVGDLNSAPDDPVFSELGSPFNGTNPYDILTGTGGFTDTWALLHPQDPGFTCCNEADLLNPEPTLVERIDHVLQRAGGTAYRSKVIGVDPDNRTDEGLWPSDHAGVTAALAP